MKNKCYSCGGVYDRLSQHWALSSSCDYPNLNDYEKEIITGCLMGDGCISMQEKANPRLQVTMTNKEYLKYLESELRRISNDVRLHRTAEQLAKQKSSNKEKYKDAYILATRTLPELSEYSKWYNTGKKVFPEDLSITPVVFSHWYAGDGSRYKTRSAIHSVNEKENFEKIEKMFKRSDLPEPDRFGKEKIVWNKEASQKLLSMTPIMPGFEYKWNI